MLSGAARGAYTAPPESRLPGWIYGGLLLVAERGGEGKGLSGAEGKGEKWT